jgi:hypothetical protein
MINSGSRAGSTVGDDPARGWTAVILWGGLAAILVAGSPPDPFRLPLVEAGTFLIVGAAWLGGSSLASAAPCGRTHRWIDGAIMRVLAFVELLNLLGVVRFSWSPFSGAIWSVALGSFVV